MVQASLLLIEGFSEVFGDLLLFIISFHRRWPICEKEHNITLIVF